MSQPLSSIENVMDRDRPDASGGKRKGHKAAARLDTPATDDVEEEQGPASEQAKPEQADDSDFEEEQEVEQQPRKRQRKSGGRKLEPTPDDSDEEMADVSDEEEGASQAKKPRASAKQKKKALAGELTGGAAGTIARVDLYNIMCHKNLSVDLIDNVNFVTGQNGSGKSSILTALMVALGGKARATSRGDSAKSVILDGAPWGEITVYLRNSGEEAYREDVYGDHIRVIRRLAKTGAGSYKIQNSEGVTISNKRADLQEILDHYFIDVMNPLCILTQEMAKKFLANSSEEEKYRFFLKGTNLESLKEDVNHLKERSTSIANGLPDIKASRDDARRKRDGLQQRYDQIQANQSLEQSIEDLKKQLAWSFVEETEKAVSDKVQDEAKRADKVEKVLERLQQFEQTVTQFNTAIAAKSEEIANLQAEGDHYTEKVNTAKLFLQTATSKAEVVQKEINEMSTNAQLNKKNKDDIEKAIREATEQAEGRNRQHLVQLEGQRAQVEGHLTRITTEINQLQQSLPAIEDELQKFSQNWTRAEADRDHFQRDVGMIERRITDIRESVRDNLRPFGEGIAAVLQDIHSMANQRKWRGQTPIGPLGKFVKLKDLKWGDLVEANLGATLNAFVVETREDEELLRSTLIRRKCKSPILRGDWSPLDVRNSEPSSEFTTMMRVLDFENELARKMLIITNRIESLLLTETREEGQRIYDRFGTRYPPNVVAILCFKPHLITIGSTKGGNSSVSQAPWNGPKRLTKATNHDVEEMQRELAEAKRKLQAANQYLQTAHGSRAQLDRQKREAMSRLRSLQQDHVVQQRHLNNIHEKLEERTETVNVATLLEEKAKIEAELELIRTQFQAARARKETLDADQRECDARFKAVRREQAEFAERASELVSEKSNLQTQLRNHQAAAGPLRNRKEEDERALATVRNELAALRAKVEADTATALEFCERVRVTKSKDKLDKELRDKQNRLKEQTNRLGSREEVEKELAEAIKVAEGVDKSYSEMKKLIESLNKAIALRINKWLDMRKAVAVRAKVIFSEIIERRFKGKINFVHDASDNEGRPKQGKLILEVQTDSRSKAGTSGGANTLSGGEKSYSQICLLISLWDAMSSPIRCLDEFDVFMDSINRNESMNLLANEAAGHRDRQHIFITPQDMSALKKIDSAHRKVVRLPDPLRNGQTRLNFPTQNGTQA